MLVNKHKGLGCQTYYVSDLLCCYKSPSYEVYKLLIHNDLYIDKRFITKFGFKLSLLRSLLICNSSCHDYYYYINIKDHFYVGS